MELTWKDGYKPGPATTQDLADEVEAEGQLGAHQFISRKSGRRCLWGTIGDCYLTSDGTFFHRQLSQASLNGLQRLQLSTRENDAFIGTPEERCAEMVRRLRAIP